MHFKREKIVQKTGEMINIKLILKPIRKNSNLLHRNFFLFTKNSIIARFSAHNPLLQRVY